MTWQVGDLGVCLKKEAWKDFDGPPHIGPSPAFNEIVRVIELYVLQDRLFLVLEGYGPTAWCATRFRKIKPDTEPANEEDATWLKDLIKKKADA